jgi:hypothetical protein
MECDDRNATAPLSVSTQPLATPLLLLTLKLQQLVLAYFIFVQVSISINKIIPFKKFK